MMEALKNTKSKIFFLILNTVGFGLIAYALINFKGFSPGFFLIALLYAIFIIFPVNFWKDDKFKIFLGDVFIVVVIWNFDLPQVILLSLISFVYIIYVRKSRNIFHLFTNTSQQAISLGAVKIAFIYLKGFVPIYESIFKNIPLILLIFVTSKILDDAIFAIDTWLISKKDFEIFKKHYITYLPFELCELPIAIMLAIVYHYEPQAIILVLIPLVLVYVAYRRGAKLAKAKRKALEERFRIQQDTHDKIYNRLGALAKLAETGSYNANGDVKKTLLKIDKDLRQSVSDLQRIISTNAPKSNYQYNLSEQLKNICLNHEKNYEQKIEYINSINFKENGDENLHDFYWNLECIIQECLNNAGKHSDADNISINLSGENGTLSLFIKDDGKGIGKFDVNNIPAGCLGLKGIIYRVKKLEGKIDILDNQGTEIKISIPFPEIKKYNEVNIEEKI